MATQATIADAAHRPSLELISVQNSIASRLLLLFLLPLVAISLVGVYAYRISSRIKEAEVVAKLVNVERLLSKDKNYKWAIAEYEQLAREYRRAPILARLGDLYFRSDKSRAPLAIETLESARRLDPQLPEVSQVLTFIYVSTHREAEAIREGARALELNPDDANTYNNLAWLHATAKRSEFLNLQLAQEYAERAVALTQWKQPSFLDTLAEVYYRRGGSERSKAHDLMLRAIDIAPREEVADFRRHFFELFPGERIELPKDS
jgi:tetratricopeptide (TPR) repeat protein